MKSYASIGSFNGNIAILELEMHEIEESKNLALCEKQTQMVTVNINIFPNSDEVFLEGDVVLVEHENGFCSRIYGKAEDEKARRVKRIREIKKAFNLK